jgi:hypothetical protein
MYIVKVQVQCDPIYIYIHDSPSSEDAINRVKEKLSSDKKAMQKITEGVLSYDVTEVTECNS